MLIWMMAACKVSEDTSGPADTESHDSSPSAADSGAPESHDSTIRESGVDTEDSESGASTGETGVEVPCDTASAGDVTDHYSPGPWLQVSCGYVHCCGLRGDGTIACWGYEDGDGATVPPCGNDFVAVATSADISCGIHQDDSLTCWGATGIHEFNGQEVDLTAPTAQPFVALDITDDSACALAPDQTVTCWGYDAYGDISSTPAGRYTQISVGTGACALDSAGTATCWANIQIDAPASDTFTAVSAGSYTGVGIMADGTLEAWTDYDPCGVDAVPSDPVSAVDLSAYYGCAIRAIDGGIDCWGFDIKPECPLSGVGGSGAMGIIEDIPSGTFTSLSTGLTDVCAIDVDGGMTCWGNLDYDYGQFNPPD